MSSRLGLFRRECDSLPNHGKSCIEYCMRLFETIVSTKMELESVVDHVDQLSNNLCSAIDLAQAKMRLHVDHSQRDIAQRVFEDISGLMTRFNTETALYDKLKEAMNTNLNVVCQEARIVAGSLLEDFERSGITLPYDKRQEFAKLQMKIQAVGIKFEDRQHNIDLALKHLHRLVSYRAQAAELLGFNSYSSLFLSDKVLRTAEKVRDFLKPFRQSEGSRSIKNDFIKTGLDLSTAVMILQRLSLRIFDVQFTPFEYDLWGRPALRLACFDPKTRAPYGEVYLIGESGGIVPCHFPIRTWRQIPSRNVIYNEDGIQTPICILHVNIDDPDDLQFTELQGLFHEYGHAMHTITARTKYHHLSGTRCKLDFAEVPSLLMEHLMLDEYTFDRVHLPRGFITRLEDYKDVVQSNRSIMLADQSRMAELDQLIHDQDVIDQSDFGTFANLIHQWCTNNSANFLKSHQLKYQVANFRHLVPYGAGYYSYLFCDHIAKRIQDKYFDKTCYQPGVFLSNALRYGGTRNTAEILEELAIKI